MSPSRSTASQVSPPHNVVLVTIDCLRADHAGCYGYPRPTTPFLDRLAERGTRFAEAISQGGATPEAFPAILASADPPAQHPFHDAGAYRAHLGRQVTLAEALRERGYRTGAIHSNPYLSRFYGYDRGFDTFDDGLRIGSRRARLGLTDRFMRLLGGRSMPFPTLLYFLETLRPPYLTAERLTGKAIAWLGKQSNAPFFLWLHYMDAHMPYAPPGSYARRFDYGAGRLRFARARRKVGDYRRPVALTDRERDTIVAYYDSAIAYIDGQLATLDARLRDAGLDATTAIVVTADHGEEFGEHGGYFHGKTLYDETVRVPLIVRAPGYPEGVVVTEQVRSLDIAPTILDLAGIEPPPAYRGRSLVAALRGEPPEPRPAISATTHLHERYLALSCRDDGWKLMVRVNDGATEFSDRRLYDLTADRGETTNLIESERERGRAERLEATLRHAYERMRDGDAGPPAFDAKTARIRERARRIGRSVPRG